MTSKAFCPYNLKRSLKKTSNIHVMYFDSYRFNDISNQQTLLYKPKPPLKFKFVYWGPFPAGDATICPT